MSLKIASLNEKRSIYEIFRSCRLCGAGGGYKMPIIQNVVDLDDNDVELCQKIKECVQIEVAIDDKMPPLICELCIDKINDFYAFQSLCKNTNSQTRTRLGLPPQNRSSSPVEESILGVTEALCERGSSDSEPRVSRSTLQPGKSKPQAKSKKVAVKVEKEQTPPTKIKQTRRPSPPPPKQSEPKKQPRALTERRESSRPLKEQSNGNSKTSKPVKSGGTKSRIRFESSSSPSPPPMRVTRTKTSEELFDELAWDSGSSVSRRDRDSSPLVDRDREKKTTSKPGPKSKQAAGQSPKGNSKFQPTKETKKDKSEEDKPKTAKKRASEVESLRLAVPAKRAKPTPAKPKERREPPKPAPKALATPAVPIACDICSETFMSNAARQNHARTHVVTFTEPRLSCNACEDWFSTYEEAATHHKWHRTGPNPYTCSVCTFEYDTLNEYNVHIEKYSCRKLYEEPDVQCLQCWNDFPTQTSLSNHKCLGEAGRPGGKCSKCGKMYALLKNLISHESDCTKERRSNIDPEILYKIKPTQVLVAKCDKLLANKIGLRYDVANVPSDYGVDPNCYYPYLRRRGLKNIKTEKTPFDGMVKITDDIRKQFEDYENSDFLSDEDETNIGEGNPKTVKKLSKLCVKAMSKLENFSKILNSKRKKVKSETAFDDLLNDDQPAFSQSYNFDSLIDSLGHNDDSGEESVIKGFGFPEKNKVQNNEKDCDLSKCDDVSKSDDIPKRKEDISPKKDSAFDIDSILKSDSCGDKNRNDNKSTTEAMDIDITNKDNVNDIDQSDETQSDKNENGFKSLENSDKSPLKESSTIDVIKSNEFTTKNYDTNNTNNSSEINENNLTQNNGMDSSEVTSQNNDPTINQSDSQSSKKTDEKINSDSFNLEKNGVENANIVNENELSENVKDKELVAASNEEIGENL